MSTADTPARGVEPGDATRLSLVAQLAAWLALAFPWRPSVEAWRQASRLVSRAAPEERAEAVRLLDTEANCAPAGDQRGAYRRAAAAFIRGLDEPAGERRQPEAGEVGT